jgi:hypothetical protein
MLDKVVFPFQCFLLKILSPEGSHFLSPGLALIESEIEGKGGATVKKCSFLLVFLHIYLIFLTALQMVATFSHFTNGCIIKRHGAKK